MWKWGDDGRLYGVMVKCWKLILSHGGSLGDFRWGTLFPVTHGGQVWLERSGIQHHKIVVKKNEKKEYDVQCCELLEKRQDATLNNTVLLYNIKNVT